jgi:carboxyl-terminal processing protease
VRHILNDLKQQHVDGIVIDLRQNGGGSLQEAVELTGLFIPDGPVVQVRNSNGDIDVENDPDPEMVYDGPLAVLVNRFSASASEIFAGAMQDYGRGIILGAPTFGKGTVQTLVNLNRFVPDAETPLGQLKLTIAKFYRINGSSTQHRGVIPDISFPSPYENDDVGESAQDFALPWDEINSVNYGQKYDLASIVPKLLRRHQQRIGNDKDYQQLIKDIDEARQAQNKTTVSLLESQRRKEREDTEYKRLERENQWRITQGLPLLKPGEAIPADSDDVTRPDPLMDESIHILADMISLLQTDVRSVVMTK